MDNIPYSFLDRLFHRLTIGNRLFSSFAMQLELGGKSPMATVQGKHVFICGLARSGTTLLLRTIYGTGAFSSMTYRDMPMVLNPLLWSRISRHATKSMAPVERAHGDGVLVDYDSPEAFEEVFWRTSEGKSYILENALIPHEPTVETIENFRIYIHNILTAKSKPLKRYLSKNNNNILRLKALRTAFPNAVCIIVFRDPLQQALSLLRQHNKFTVLGEKKSFIPQYMEWLGHFEFGVRHKPFRFFDTPSLYAIDTLDYWLLQWKNVYTKLSNDATLDCIFLSYEALCTESRQVLDALSGVINANISNENNIISSRNREIQEPYSKSLYQEILHIYEALFARQGRWLRAGD